MTKGKFTIIYIIRTLQEVRFLDDSLPDVAHQGIVAVAGEFQYSGSLDAGLIVHKNVDIHISGRA
jgi:hypothetical protein